MNTCIWGPPTWRVLEYVTSEWDAGHTTHATPASAIPGGETGPLSEAVVALGAVLPCSYCRNSFKDFALTEAELAALAAAERCACSPGPEDTTGTLHWLWRIHNKVNHKLWRQKLEGVAAGCDIDVITAAMEVPFRLVYKRVSVASPCCSIGDILTMVGIFLLNAVLAAETEQDCAHRLRGMAAFLRALGTLLQSSRHFACLGSAMIAGAACQLASCGDTPTSEDAAVEQVARFYSRLGVLHPAPKARALLAARAHACKSGVCH